MPRKAKLKDEEDEKSREIKELKPELTQEEINSLEQMIEENDAKVNSQELREFLRGEEVQLVRSSPSLERINPPQKNQLMLERDIITGTPSITTNPNKNGENNEDNGFKYIPETQAQNQPHYIHYGERVGEVTRIRDIERPKMPSPFERRETIADGSLKTTPDIESFEKYTVTGSPVRKSEKEKFMKRDPFEKKEVKYTPEKY